MEKRLKPVTFQWFIDCSQLTFHFDYSHDVKKNKLEKSQRKQYDLLF